MRRDDGWLQFGNEKSGVRITLTYPALESSRNRFYGGRRRKRDVVTALKPEMSSTRGIVRPVGRLPLVHGSQRLTAVRTLMSKKINLAKDTSRVTSRVVIVMVFRVAGNPQSERLSLHICDGNLRTPTGFIPLPTSTRCIMARNSPMTTGTPGWKRLPGIDETAIPTGTVS